MTAGLRALALCAAGAACSGTEELSFEAPREGLPWMAKSYTVEIELLANECAPGGLVGVTGQARAEVVQQGVTVARWIQKAADLDDASWALSGALCETEAGGLSVRLRGGRVGREKYGDGTCEVEAAVPFDKQRGRPPADACADARTIALVMDDCGVLTGEVDTELRFARDCARPDCRIKMRWVARPVEAVPGTPADNPYPGRAADATTCD